MHNLSDDMSSQSDAAEADADAVLTIPKEMLARVRPTNVQGPVMFDNPKPARAVPPELRRLHSPPAVALVEVDVLSRHIVALENHLQLITQLVAAAVRSNTTGSSSNRNNTGQLFPAIRLPPVPAEEPASHCQLLPKHLMLSRVSVSRALRQAALVSARVAGYRAADTAAVEMLADLMHDFLGRVGVALRSFQDREAMRRQDANDDLRRSQQHALILTRASAAAAESGDQQLSQQQQAEDYHRPEAPSSEESPAQTWLSDSSSHHHQADAVDRALRDVGMRGGVSDVRDFVNSLRARRARLLEDCRTLHARAEAATFLLCQQQQESVDGVKRNVGAANAAKKARRTETAASSMFESGASV